VSGQLHIQAPLCHRKKDPRYPLDRRLGGPQSRSGHRFEEKIFFLYQRSNLDRPVIQFVVRYYTELPQLLIYTVYQILLRIFNQERGDRRGM
jgi:hypothetical protein